MMSFPTANALRATFARLVPCSLVCSAAPSPSICSVVVLVSLSEEDEDDEEEDEEDDSDERVVLDVMSGLV